MKRFALWAVLMLCAGTASAQSVISWGQRIVPIGQTATSPQGALKIPIEGAINPADSTGVPIQSDGTGVYVTQLFPQMDANLTFASIINNTSIALGGADSSAVLDTHRMRLGMLLIKPFPGTTTGTGDTTVTFRVALQIRTHLNGASDSSSTFAIYLYGRSDVGAVTTSAGQTDTTSQGQLLAGVPTTALNATPDANSPWSGEYTLVIMAKRFAHATSIAVNGHTFYYPNGMAIPLSSIFGRDIYSPYTSVRVRLMTVEKANAAFATEGLGLTVSLVGTPL